MLTIEHAMKYSFSLDALTWSPDEAYIAAQSDSVNVKVWNSITGQCTATLRGHTEKVVSVAWSEDGRLASASEDGQVRIWNAETGQCLKVLGEDEDLDGYLFSIVWSHDGSQIARTSIPPSWAVYYTMLKQIDWRQEGRVWNTDTWEATSNAKPFLSLGWSFNRLLTISPLDSDHVSIQDFVTGEEICSLEDSLDQLYSSAPFEKVFWGQGQIAINHHSHVNVWDITSCKLIATLKDLPGDMSSPISTIVWSEGGIRLASPSVDRKAFSVWDESSKQETTLFGHRNLVAALSWSPDGTRLASYTDDGTIQIWDPAAGASATTADVSTLDFHAEPVESVEWSQNGKYLVSTSLAKNGFQDRYWNSIKVWDASTNQSLFHHESMGTYSWSADGKRIAIVTLHGIEIHDLENPQDNSLDITLSESSDFAVTFHRSFFPTCILTWSRQGDKLACTWLTGTIGFWAVEKDSSLRKMDEYIEFFDKRSPFRPTTWTISSRRIEALAWSDDGNFLAIAATDEIKIWDPNKNQWTITIGDKVPLPELEHKTLAWSKDGTRIAASSHHWVKVWSVTGDLLGKLEIPQTDPQQCSLVRKAGDLCYNSHIDSVQFDGTSRDRLRVMYDFNHTCIYQLPGVLPDINPLDHLSSQSVGYNWDQDENWITYQGKRILKVPIDYRVREDAVAGLGGRIALGCESGQVLIFNLRD